MSLGGLRAEELATGFRGANAEKGEDEGNAIHADHPWRGVPFDDDDDVSRVTHVERVPLKRAEELVGAPLGITSKALEIRRGAHE